MFNKTWLLSLSLSLFFFTNFAMATAGRVVTKTSSRERIAVAIGYSDGPDSFWQTAGLADYPYYPVMSQKTLRMTTDLLRANDFWPSGEFGGFVSSWINSDGSIQIDIINPNDKCANSVKIGGQLKEERRSPWLCQEQQTKSRATAKYIRDNIFNYDAFIYVGHARYGSGLAFGDFNDEKSKVEIYGLSRKYLGTKSQLKIVGILSCDSVNHYSTAFDSLYDSAPPKFVGINAKEIEWYPPVLVKKEVELLQSILASGGVRKYQQMLPAKSAY